MLLGVNFNDEMLASPTNIIRTLAGKSHTAFHQLLYSAWSIHLSNNTPIHSFNWIGSWCRWFESKRHRREFAGLIIFITVTVPCRQNSPTSLECARCTYILFAQPYWSTRVTEYHRLDTASTKSAQTEPQHNMVTMLCGRNAGLFANPVVVCLCFGCFSSKHPFGFS